MKRWLSLLVLSFIFSMIPSANAQSGETPAIPCGSPPHEHVCLGRLDVPAERRPAFLAASRAAVDALYSPGFEADLRAFIAVHSRIGPHAERWRGVEASAMIAALRRAMQGQDISTLGGLHGWFSHLLFHNTAYDGRTSGPILFNRFALDRTTASLANTIVHEVAHRIGLGHRRQGRSPAARCEPPYVIGSLIEKAVTGPGWRPSPDDCSLLT